MSSATIPLRQMERESDPNRVQIHFRPVNNPNQLEEQEEETGANCGNKSSGNILPGILVTIIFFVIGGILRSGSTGSGSTGSGSRGYSSSYDNTQQNRNNYPSSTYYNNEAPKTSKFVWMDKKGGECEKEECKKSAETILSWMDQDINPCDNFFQYSCGNWGKFNKEPQPNNSTLNISTVAWDNFSKLKQSGEDILHGILSKPLISDTDETDKIKFSYRMCFHIGIAGFEALLNKTDTDSEEPNDPVNIKSFIENLSNVAEKEKPDVPNDTKFRKQVKQIYKNHVLKVYEDLDKISDKNKTEISFCLEIVRIVHGKRFLEKMYIDAINYNRNNTIKVAEMMGTIQTSLREICSAVSGSTWTTKNIGAKNGLMDILTKMEVLKGIQIIKPCIGYSPHLEDEDATLADLAEYKLRMERMEKAAANSTIRIEPKCFWISYAYKPNAMYHAIGHSLEVSAAILQPPFLDEHRPLAMNYGSIGSILGHELGHSIASDYFPNPRNLQLGRSARCLFNQYGRFNVTIQDKIEFGNVTINPGILSLNATATFVEDFADNLGFLGAYKAFKALLSSPGYVSMKLPGLQHLTQEQLFFLGFAQTWCSEMSVEMLAIQMKKDDHAPERFRVLGVLRNSNEFASAWKCPIKSGMNPIAKCKLV